MAFGLWITRRADMLAHAVGLVVLAGFAPALWAGGCAVSPSGAADKPIYLTFDTGHMAVAPLIADVLKKNDVQVTFFAAQERTKIGNGSLGSDWASWWKARAAEGHDFASHTYDHTYWRADVTEKNHGVRFRVRPSAGPQEGQEQVWTAAQYCAEIQKSELRLQEITGQKTLPLFRAPGG